MAQITFVPFERRHLEEMEIEVPAWQESDIGRCRGWTMLADGKPLGAGGICPMWPGVAEAWMFTRPGWSQYYLRVWTQIRRRIPQLMAEEGLWRLQAACLKDPAHWGWLKLCGFKLEGLMEAYGKNGEDFIRAARLQVVK